MMGVIWHILESETGNAEHPGKIGDYVSYTDFNVDFEIGDTDAVAHVIASTFPKNVAEARRYDEASPVAAPSRRR
jgi:hypothetical protein